MWLKIQVMDTELTKKIKACTSSMRRSSDLQHQLSKNLYIVSEAYDAFIHGVLTSQSGDKTRATAVALIVLGVYVRFLASNL